MPSVPMPSTLRTGAAAIVMATFLAPAAPLAQRSSYYFSGSSGSRPYSAGVIITTMTNRDPQGVSTLDLLVLWRGTAGWYTKNSGAGHRGGGGGGFNGRSERLQYAGIDLNIYLARDPRALQIQDKPVTLKPADANVVLVDDVDAPTGPRVVSTLRVDPSMPDGDLHIESVLRRSAEIVAFLKCDDQIDHPMLSAMVKRNCDLVLSR